VEGGFHGKEGVQEKEGVEGKEETAQGKEEGYSKKCEDECSPLSLEKKIEKLDEEIDLKFELLENLEDAFSRHNKKVFLLNLFVL
jgi:hypothetical protein